jgi:hypothetical protein
MIRACSLNAVDEAQADVVTAIGAILKIVMKTP